MATNDGGAGMVGMLRSIRGKLSSPPFDVEDIHEWRERVLSIILFVVVVLGSVAAIPSVLFAASDGLWSIAFVDCVALIWVVFISMRRSELLRAACLVGHAKPMNSPAPHRQRRIPDR